MYVNSCAKLVVVFQACVGCLWPVMGGIVRFFLHLSCINLDI